MLGAAWWMPAHGSPLLSPPGAMARRRGDRQSGRARAARLPLRLGCVGGGGGGGGAGDRVTAMLRLRLLRLRLLAVQQGLAATATATAPPGRGSALLR
eukprot:COSAG01_NODE_3902_length_5561_cov_14.696448_4_plen_98_part_00